ncbi:hypothetical protein IIC44_02750, partial [Patescibacteria group bacterium]|nr:hypothetical protein [Patescibacteria group bacterium]
MRFQNESMKGLGNREFARKVRQLGKSEYTGTVYIPERLNCWQSWHEGQLVKVSNSENLAEEEV